MIQPLHIHKSQISHGCVYKYRRMMFLGFLLDDTENDIGSSEPIHQGLWSGEQAFIYVFILPE